MAKDEAIEVEGIVEEVLPNAKFKVRIDKTDKTVLAHISGKLRMNFIRVSKGDKVKMEISPYDVTKARITWRSK